MLLMILARRFGRIRPQDRAMALDWTTTFACISCDFFGKGKSMQAPLFVQFWCHARALWQRICRHHTRIHRLKVEGCGAYDCISISAALTDNVQRSTRHHMDWSLRLSILDWLTTLSLSTTTSSLILNDMRNIWLKDDNDDQTWRSYYVDIGSQWHKMSIFMLSDK
jgi:hypothetical protein